MKDKFRENEHKEELAAKKVVVNEITNSVIAKLPSELTDMLKAAREANNPKPEDRIRTTNPDSINKNLPDSSKLDDLSNVKKTESKSAIIEQEGERKKVVVNEITNSVITKLPSELTDMLKAAREANNPKPEDRIRKINPDNINKNLPDSSKLDDLSNVKKTESKSAIIEQEGERKKVVVNEITNSVITKLPSELSDMLKAAREANNPKPEDEIKVKNTTSPNIKTSTEPNLKSHNPFNSKKNTGSLPPPPPTIKNTVSKSVNVNKQNNREMIIDESGSFLNIVINESNQKDVIETMKNISKVNITNPRESIFKYDDLGIGFYFTNSGKLQEITFSYPFEGRTLKGLKLDDQLTKAVEMYGQPKMRTPAGAIWKKFAVFLKDDLVTTIRLRDA